VKDAYICDSIRTPIGRYGGSLSSVRADDLAALPITALLERNSSLDPKAIEEVILGCANQAGEDNRNIARMAALLGGLPETVPGVTINRLCGSGMDAIGTAARMICAHEAELVIAGGIESMSRAPFVMPKADTTFSRRAEIYDTTIGWRFVNKRMHTLYGTDSMPDTGENIAEQFKISREDQDRMAQRSQQRAAMAISSGRLAEEICPVILPQRKGEAVIVRQDEHPRAGVTFESLMKLPALFREGGTVTVGNAAGVNDGSAAILVASEAAIARHSLAPIARIITMATAGVAPRVMGIGPAPATHQALTKAGLTIADIGIVELNEAFASQGLAVLRHLGIDDDDERVNPNGGAIALGHPLGMSGARLVMTAARELQHRNEKYALCTMCVGVGQGIAVILERI